MACSTLFFQAFQLSPKSSSLVRSTTIVVTSGCMIWLYDIVVKIDPI